MMPSTAITIFIVLYGVVMPMLGLADQQPATGPPHQSNLTLPATDDMLLALKLQQVEQALRRGEVFKARKAVVQAQILDDRGGGHRSLDVSLLTATVQIAGGRYTQAETTLKTLVRQLPSNDPVRAVALSNLGNVYMAQERVAYALREYQQAQQSFPDMRSPLRIKIDLNRAQALNALSRHTEARAVLQKILPELGALPSDARKVPLLLSAAQRLADLSVTSTSIQAQRYTLLREAEKLATKNADDNARATALMALSTLYSDTNRFKEALTLSREALFYAQRTNIAPLLVQLQWQLARLHRQLGDNKASLLAYRAAMALLQARSDQLSQFRVGGSPIETLLSEAADALLRPLDTEIPPLNDADKAARLEEVRYIIELTRAESLNRYFQDNCVSDLKHHTKGIEQIDPATLVIYPIAFPDRLELLVSGQDFITHVQVPVTRQALDHALYSLRTNLQLGARVVYQYSAQEVYNWLIRPIEPVLKQRQPKTLVFVPNATLQMVPLAALYDGQHYLIEHYAVATTPGLSLTKPSKFDHHRLRLLIAGVSDSVQGFTDLPYVKQEVTELADHYPSKLFLNQSFTLPALEAELNTTAFPVLHLASHGQFEADARSSYILSYDGKMSINDIQSLLTTGRFLDTPVELLTLSACSTATGDARSALGLGGLAVKSGAQTVLASLWLVNDQPTEALMAAFYQQLALPVNSRARALQLAQQQMLSHPQYRNPRYWAPFVLVGNWQ